MKHISEATFEAAEFAVEQRQAGEPLSLADLLSLADDEPEVDLPQLFVLVLGSAPSVVLPAQVRSDQLGLLEAINLAALAGGWSMNIEIF